MTIFSIFRRAPPASILAFLQSDFACRSHGTGAILRRVFWQILGTFRGQKVHFSAILDHFFDFSRQFLSRSLVRAHKTTHQHMPNNFVFHHIPILGPKNLCLSNIVPISHHAHQQLCLGQLWLSAIWSFFATFKSFSLFSFLSLMLVWLILLCCQWLRTDWLCSI